MAEVPLQFRMKDAVSWAATHNTEKLVVYKYTRVGDASFLCWNPDCEFAKKGIPVAASRFDKTNDCWVPNHCSCGATGMSLRRNRQAPQKYDPFDEENRWQLAHKRHPCMKETLPKKKPAASKVLGVDDPDASDSSAYENSVSSSVDDDLLTDEDSFSSEDDGGDEPSVQSVESEYNDWSIHDPNSIPAAIFEDHSAKGFARVWNVIELDINSPAGLLYEKAKTQVQLSAGLSDVYSRYGRLLPVATATMLNFLEINPSTDVFVDFGHGLGNVALQAAFTKRCRVRGIEVNELRYRCSVAYQIGFEKFQQTRSARLPESSEVQMMSMFLSVFH